MAPLTEEHTASIVEFVPELDRLAADVMADWKVPGAALAVVQDGKVALAKGYGQRDVAANLPVTPLDAVRDRLDHQIVYRDRCGSLTR
jgi:CubicO group peptidase (beta-lactamase class C family)